MIACLFLGTTACGNAPASFGSHPDSARANASELAGALATRFTNVRRIGTLDHTHDQLVRHALFPSRLIDDSTIWSGPRTGSTRTLSVYGTKVGSQYHLATRRASPHPQHSGDIRINTSLSRIAPSEYQWGATSDLALGHLTSDDFFRGVRASFAELELRGERGTRAEYRASLPKTTAALGAPFSVDSIRSEQKSDGSTRHILTIGMDTDRVRKKYPAYGKYLEKYVSPSRYHITLTDRSGAKWLDAEAGDKRLVLRMRTRGGEMLPLDGAPRPLPDSLRLRVDLTVHILFFDVGMSELMGDLAVVRTEREKGFAIRFRREPKWQFPLATDKLIKTPLRRPFAGEGALFRLTVRDSAGTQTVMSREVGMAVQESGILRFLARLNRSAADDFTTTADVESNRFLSDIFSALRSDIRAGMPRTVKAEGEF